MNKKQEVTLALSLGVLGVVFGSMLPADTICYNSYKCNQFN
jgi:hypothetical protein